jgi:ATP-dependent Clp protease ATP-binding subunit ClpA
MPRFIWSPKASPAWMCCATFPMPRQRKKNQKRGRTRPRKCLKWMTEKPQRQKKKDPLELFTTNLLARAENNRIDPLIGRENELDRVMQVLCRRRKNNPILVGDPGVGKTAIAEGLALKIHNKQVPSAP